MKERVRQLELLVGTLTLEVDILLEQGFQISLAKKGNPNDNATAEGFMKTLKTEAVCLWEYRILAHVQLRLPYFIKQVYHHQLRHSSIGYLPQNP